MPFTEGLGLDQPDSVGLDSDDRRKGLHAERVTTMQPSAMLIFRDGADSDSPTLSRPASLDTRISQHSILLSNLLASPPAALNYPSGDCQPLHHETHKGGAIALLLGQTALTSG